MRKNIQNDLLITCNGVDLQSVTNIQFYVRQQEQFLEYVPDILSANEMTVRLPLADACKLQAGTVLLQFAFVDADGNPRASEIVQIPVGELLKEAGYDPV